MNLDRIIKICYRVCLFCIYIVTIILLFMIWVAPELPYRLTEQAYEYLQRTYLSLGVLFIASALTIKICKMLGGKLISGEGQKRDLSGLVTSIGAFFFVFLILAVIGASEFRDYKIRSRMINDVGVVVADVEEFIGSYYYQHRRAPDSLEQMPSLPLVKKIDFNNQSGAVTIIIATPPFEDKSFSLIPSISLDENKEIIWQCLSEDIPSKYLGRHCYSRK